jgi:hypothetical protein
MRRACAAVLAAASALAGCATPYASSGVTGGYGETHVTDRMVEVTFTGNGYTDADRIQTFALYRCAEIARKAGKPWFTLYDSLSAAARNRPARLPRVGTLGGKPAAVAFVLLHEQAQPGAQDAQEILARLGPSVDLGAEARRKP